MARLGGSNWIDASEKNIKVLNTCQKNNLKINYLNKSPEQLKNIKNLI